MSANITQDHSIKILTKGIGILFAEHLILTARPPMADEF
jgi:hypothetical protein